MKLSIDHIPLDDSLTWELFARGDTKGVFQLETSLGKSWCKKLKPTNIEELAALVALLRPSCLKALSGDPPKSMTQRYVDRKNGEEEVTYEHPLLEPILKTTYAQLVYQEQSILIAQQLAGFSLQQGDELRKCIAENSLVLTNSGPKYIQDIKIKQGTKPQILSVDEYGKRKYVSITNVWCTGTQDVYEIISTNGYKIQLTKQHKVFTQDGWKTVENLSTNDFIVIPNRYQYKGDNKHNINVNLSILLGYFIGEGCYTDKCDPKITNSDDWIVNKITDILTSEFGNDSYKIYYMKNGCKDIYLRNSAKQWIISIVNKAKSRYKIIPSIVSNAYNSITKAFVGAFFSGEGDVSIRYRQASISSTSYEIIQMLQILLLRDGIYAGINIHNSTYKNEPYQSFRLIICGFQDVYKFTKTYQEYICPTKLNQLLQIEPGTHNNTKFLIPSCFIKAISSVTNLNSLFGTPKCRSLGGSDYQKNLTYDKASRMNQIINSEMLDTILKADYKFVQIKNITYVGIKKVYDFTVDDDIHCGFINGILVHNSIGKKLPKLMAEVKIKFIEGCQKHSNLSQEEAEKIFGWIEKGARYQFNKCLYPHTVVRTYNGPRKLNQLEIGDLVDTPSGWSKVTNIYDNGKQTLYYIGLWNRKNIICTLDHKLLCDDGNLYPVINILRDKRKVVCYDSEPFPIKFVQYVGLSNTLDIEVDNEDHIFYAQDIACSNSHAVSYAINSYRTAYCKAHYPLQFYCAYLRGANWKSDSAQEVRELVNDAKLHNIEILPPRLSDKSVETYIVGSNIVRFGLGDIRGVGQASLKTLLDLLTTIKVTSWFDYLVNISPNVSSIVNVALINSGALDEYGVTRAQMLFEYQMYKTLTNNERAFINESPLDNLKDALIACAKPKKEGGGCHNKNRIHLVKEMVKSLDNPPHSLEDIPERIIWEEEKYIGVALTYSKSSCTSQSLHANSTCKEVSDGKRGFLVVSTEISRVSKINTKTGKKMAFVDITDETGTLEGVPVFPSQFEELKDMIYTENIVLIQLDYTKDGSIYVKNIWEDQ